jgi:lactate dehydrogenase-like 2-hydroxyacid dehydrogenase
LADAGLTCKGGYKEGKYDFELIFDIGNRIANIAEALGMNVLMAERKGVEEVNVRNGRTSFPKTLKTCTALILACPLTPATQSMIGEDEFRLMGRDAILINVARGGIVVEEAMIKALKECWIAGAGTDVFVTEPASRGNSVLVQEAANVPNLVMSPHVAWYARSSIERLRQTVQFNIEGFWKGELQNLVDI